MPYPDHLLPIPGYHYITDISCVRNRNLIRYFSGSKEDFIDHVTGRAIPESISSSKGMMDLSTSLLGTYKTEDNRISITGGRKKFFTMELWPVGEKIELPPDESEFITRENGIDYFFLIKEVDGYKIPFTIVDEKGQFEAKLKVVHTPCRSNFWHFSIRVLDEKGEDIDKKNAGRNNPFGRDKQILKAARKVMRELISLDIPELSVIPAEIYSNINQSDELASSQNDFNAVKNNKSKVGSNKKASNAHFSDYSKMSKKTILKRLLDWIRR